MKDPMIRYRIRAIPDDGSEPVFICNTRGLIDFTSIANAKQCMNHRKN